MDTKKVVFAAGGCLCSLLFVFFVANLWYGRHQQQACLDDVDQNLVPRSHTSRLLPKSHCEELLEKTKEEGWVWSVNSSNPGKINEFGQLFQENGIALSKITQEDLREINSTDIDVVVHKASQISENGTLVEDSSMNIEGANIGVNLKWHIPQMPNFVGRTANLVTLLAFRVENVVFVYKGEVAGQIVDPRGALLPGFTVNTFFEPMGTSFTLAEKSDPLHNPRTKAFDKFANGKFLLCSRVINSWQGAWQDN